MSSRMKELREAFKRLRIQVDNSGTLNSGSIKEVIAFDENLAKFRAELDQESLSDQPTWEIACEEMYEILCEAKLFANRAFENINSLKADNSSLKRQVELLQEQVKKLEETVETLNIKISKINTHEEKLILGQVAYDIEQYVAKIVLDPLVGPKHYISSIEKLQSAIKGDDNYADIFPEATRRKAEDNWKDLQEQIKWNLDLFRYMGTLKKGRISSAHPPVDKEKAIAAMKKNVPRFEQEKFRTLLKIHEELEVQIQRLS